MAYTTIDDPTIYFNTVLYTGANKSITGVNFQPDWVWIKERDSGYHAIFDSIRGVTKILSSNVNNAEDTQSDTLTAFGTDGFTLGADSNNYVGGSSTSTVSWNWKETATAGFDIVSFTGNDTARTISHSLSAVPNMMILKDRDAGNDWFIYHSGNTSAPETDYLKLNSSATTADLNSLWNDTAPTSSVFTIGTNGNINTTGNDYIAYLFSEKKGYSKFGKYVGNNNDDGTFVYLGFKPAFVLIKIIDTQTDNWIMQDNKINSFNGASSQRLRANSSGAEFSSSNEIDLLSNGFKVHGADGEINGSGASYIYMAFAESPFVNSKGVPNNAR